jgi:sulfatase maturation enzyme AslB (radical SAM superfamily)
MGKIRPCCYSTSEQPIAEYQGESVEQIFNLSEHKRFRADLMNGVSREDHCWRCYHEEELTGHSQRTRTNLRYQDVTPALLERTADDGYLDDPRILFWDVRFSNLCNFRCRTCGPEYSSALHDEAVHHGLIPRKTVNTFEVEKLDMFLSQVKHVRQVYFAGGEPLLMEAHYKILEAMLAEGRAHIPIYYNTNMSILKHKNWDVVEMWKKFSNLIVAPSIDEVGERAEYLRKGTRWKVMVENVARVRRECPHIDLRPSITVSALNVLRLPEILRELWKLEIVKPKALFHLNYVDTPEFFHLAVAPLKKRLQVRDQLEKMRSEMVASPFRENLIQKFDDLLKILAQPDRPLGAEALKHLQIFDRIRGEAVSRTPALVP